MILRNSFFLIQRYIKSVQMLALLYRSIQDHVPNRSNSFWVLVFSLQNGIFEVYRCNAIYRPKSERCWLLLYKSLILKTYYINNCTKRNSVNAWWICYNIFSCFNLSSLWLFVGISGSFLWEIVWKQIIKIFITKFTKSVWEVSQKLEL